MNRVVTVLSCIFGYMFLALSVFVTTETIMRKLFNFSFQGADELGGYALAVGSSLAFTIALLGRNHIRIDLLHERLPPAVQSVLNWLAIVLLAMFGVLLGWVCFNVVVDTMSYRSTAP
ncbi:MAG: TRAP transporter small permease, partial [Alphaproteobacteria bacterium]